MLTFQFFQKPLTYDFQLLSYLGASGLFALGIFQNLSYDNIYIEFKFVKHPVQQESIKPFAIHLENL